MNKGGTVCETSERGNNRDSRRITNSLLFGTFARVGGSVKVGEGQTNVSGRERGLAFSSDLFSHAVNCLVASKVYQRIKRTCEDAYAFQLHL